MASGRSLSVTGPRRGLFAGEPHPGHMGWGRSGLAYPAGVTDEAEVTRNPLGKFVVVAVVLAAFGPYLIGGLRWEQVAIYGLLLLALPLTWPRARATPLAVRIFATWMVYALVALIGAVAPSGAASIFPRGAALAGIDNVMGPLAVMLLVWATVRADAASGLLRTASKLMAMAMAINGVLAVVMTRIDLGFYLRRFWATAGDQVTVAENAAALGRVTGVFNQPAEAGLAYGVAGLAACYVWQERPRRLYLVLIPIIIGGLLSVSKVFILVGLPLILWHIWRARASHGRIALLTVGAATFLGIAQSGYATQWVGLDYLGRLLRPSDQGWLSFYTAGRIGDHATLATVVGEVIRLDPWFGLGAGGLRVPYDNGWVEAFVTAGTVGVVCYTLVLLLLWRTARAINDPARRRLLYGLTVLAVAGSMGVPALTANRAATLLWVLIALSASAQLAHLSARPNYLATQPVVLVPDSLT